MYKVREGDLVDQLEGFPIEVVQKMVDIQFEQTGKTDISVFQRFGSADAEDGGFNWDDAICGEDFWHKVIVKRKFNKFFECFPKQEANIKPSEDPVEVDQVKNTDYVVKPSDLIGQIKNLKEIDSSKPIQTEVDCPPTPASSIVLTKETLQKLPSGSLRHIALVIGCSFETMPAKEELVNMIINKK